MKKVRYMFVALFVLAAAALVAGPLSAQKQRVSPHEKVSVKIGGNEVTIEYGRPYAKDPKSGQVRKVWGTLVPYGKAWRAGADEATTLITQEPIMVGDVAVPPGKYTLYMVLDDKGEAKLAISKRFGDWGILKDGTVNEKNDHARANMKREKLDRELDQFTIALESTAGGAALKMMWENTVFWVPITGKKA
jgi:Protein of unknown function (DUF2911)